MEDFWEEIDLFRSGLPQGFHNLIYSDRALGVIGFRKAPVPVPVFLRLLQMNRWRNAPQFSQPKVGVTILARNLVAALVAHIEEEMYRNGGIAIESFVKFLGLV